MSNTPQHGSDVQETPDWWMASDGRYYPPELHPDYVAPPPPPVSAPPAPTAAATAAATEIVDPSLAEQLRNQADRVGGEASAAADAALPDEAGGGGIGAGGGIAAAGGVAAGGLAAATGSLGDKLGAAKDVVADAVPDVGGASGGLGGAAGGLSDKLGSAKDAVAGAVPDVGGATGGLGDKLGSAKDAVAGAVPDVGGAAGGLGEKLGSAKDAVAGVGGAGSGLTGGVSDKLGSAKDAVGDGVSSATAAVGDAVPDIGTGAGAAAAAGGAAAGMVDKVESVVPDGLSTPLEPVMPIAPTTPDLGETIITTPPSASVPGSPPPAAGLPPMAPPTGVVDGPGGITYTPPAEPAAPQYDIGGGSPVIAPPAPGGEFAADLGVPKARKVTSVPAGVLALLAGVIALAGSFLNWGTGSISSSAGVEKLGITVQGFDSSGLISAICGLALLVFGALFFLGIPKQVYWAVLAFIAGAVIVGAVVFSLIDIADLAERYKNEWITDSRAADEDQVVTKPAIGIFLAGAGGVLGVLAAAFANRK